LAVVVLRVGAKHEIEVPASEDQGPVQALGSDRPNPALCVRVGVRRLDRGEDHLRPFRTEDLVEGAGELGVPVVDQEPHSLRATLEVHGQIPRLLGDPEGVRVIGRSRNEHAPRVKLDEHEDVEGPERDRLDREEVAGDDPLGLRTKELRPSGTRSSGAGPRPAFLRSIRTVVAPTRIPSLWSSPEILTHPQWGFSPARRRISSPTSGSIGGRPALPFEP